MNTVTEQLSIVYYNDESGEGNATIYVGADTEEAALDYLNNNEGYETDKDDIIGVYRVQVAEDRNGKEYQIGITRVEEK